MTRPDPTKKSSAQGPVALVLAVIAAGGGFIWWKTQPAPQQPPPQAEAVTIPPLAPPEAPALPPVSAEAEQGLLQAISENELLRAWLAHGDVVHRWAVVTDNLAEGVTPRRQLAFLAPKEPFSAKASGGAQVIAPESYRRYDAFADAVGSIDAAAFARVVRALHPELEATYRALGYPAASLDAVAAKALRRIEGAPVESGPVRVERERGHWIFTEERLESLGDVEKHLLRMGPRNTKVLQEKAAQLRAALGLPDVSLARHGAGK